MRFKRFGKFINDVESYLKTEVASLIDDLNFGLSRLRFEDNFACQRLTASVGTASATTVKHKLRSEVDSFLVLNGVSGVNLTYVDNNTITLQLDTDAYSGASTKSVDIVLFKG